jgi:hypothetical protein
MAEGRMRTEEEVLALAEAEHDNDETCEASYVVAFADCVHREWDIQHAAEVIESLRVLGYRVSVDPAGTLPLPLKIPA